MYDLAIIGAGISGASVAHEFALKNKKVIIFDENGLASGGSGAAGAFISPKFSKMGELRDLLNDAFVYSMDFYEKNFPHIFTKSQLLHISKDEKSSQILKSYKKDSPLNLKNISNEFLSTLSLHANRYENIFIYAGIVDAQLMCSAMIKNAEFKKQKVQSLVYDDGMWIINETYSAKNVLLATGAYKAVIKEPYISLRGIWGHRIDIKTTSINPYSIHQNVSISPSYNGELAIGATHNLHFNPQTSKEPYDINKGREELLQKAKKTLNLENIEILRDFTGLRSGSSDYMPLLGKLVLANETIHELGNKLRVKKPNFDDFFYYPNLYMINGSAGYGFVLAPYLAKILTENILSAKKIDEKLVPARFFARWARRKLA